MYYFENQNFQKTQLIKVGLLEIIFWKGLTNFQLLKMSLKIRILRCSRRLFIILISLTVLLFCKKKVFSNCCKGGLMPNLNKKYLTVSKHHEAREENWSMKKMTYLYKFGYRSSQLLTKKQVLVFLQ